MVPTIGVKPTTFALRMLAKSKNEYTYEYKHKTI